MAKSKRPARSTKRSNPKATRTAKDRAAARGKHRRLSDFTKGESQYLSGGDLTDLELPTELVVETMVVEKVGQGKSAEDKLVCHWIAEENEYGLKPMALNVGNAAMFEKFFGEDMDVEEACEKAVGLRILLDKERTRNPSSGDQCWGARITEICGYDGAESGSVDDEHEEDDEELD